ncbi:MAG: ParA family protein [Gemmatimonadales bacterium]
MKTIAFFNNKGGVGKTSLVYHLAWMFGELGVNVVAADLDPQANLSSMFLDDERLEELWPEGSHPETVYGAIEPLLAGTGDVRDPRPQRIDTRIALLAGDLSLSLAETELNSQWPACLDRVERAFRVMSAFWRVLERAAESSGAGLVLIDVGPNLGALNRAALLAAEHVVIPLAPDLYSLQGLRNLGPTLRRWREEWKERQGRNPVPSLSLPGGKMRPAGYVAMQHAVRLDRPVRAYQKWMERIPGQYREAVLGESGAGAPAAPDDPLCLATLRHYRSLMPLAQEARKPMFFLKPADGAIGGHGAAVQECYGDFKVLATRIAQACSLGLPGA